MSLVRFRFSILRYTWAFSIFVPAAHKPTVSYILDSILIFCLFYKIVGECGVEPPEPQWQQIYSLPRYLYGIFSQNPDSRVSKVIYRVMRSTRLFYAMSATWSCFGYYYAFWLYASWKLPAINARLWWLIETKKHSSDGKSDQAQAYAVTYLCSFWFTYAHPKVFSAHKTDGQHTEEMEILRFELRISRLWAGRSNRWTKFPE